MFLTISGNIQDNGNNGEKRKNMESEILVQYQTCRNFKFTELNATNFARNYLAWKSMHTFFGLIPPLLLGPQLDLNN